jgi:hypothetical protein
MWQSPRISIKADPPPADAISGRETGKNMRMEQQLVDDREDRRASMSDGAITIERGVGGLKCAICSGPLADHEIGDHESRVVERMLSIGFPTPVGSRLS